MQNVVWKQVAGNVQSVVKNPRNMMQHMYTANRLRTGIVCQSVLLANKPRYIAPVR